MTGVPTRRHDDGLSGGAYRLRVSIGTCPSQVTAINDDDRSYSTADVTLR